MAQRQAAEVAGCTPRLGVGRFIIFGVRATVMAGIIDHDTLTLCTVLYAVYLEP